MSFDMAQLEPEFDQTDERHADKAVRVLAEDLFDAVQFFIKEDPLLVVNNLIR